MRDLFLGRARLLIPAMAIVAMLAAVACGGDDDDQEPTPTAESGTPASSPTAAASPSPASAYPVTVTDLLGRSVEIKAKPATIVAISPTAVELVYAVGGTIVGRSSSVDFPEAAKAAKDIGTAYQPNFEAILALKPDLVVGVQGPGLREFAERLEARGIATHFPPTQSFDEIMAMLVELGSRLDRGDAASSLVGQIRRKRDAVERALAGRDRPRALIVFGLRPIVVAGPGSFPDEMLRLAGADNVVRSERTRFPTLGIERVLALDPDVIVDATGGVMREGMSITRDLPGWGELRAAKADRLVRIDDDRVLRPGPRVAEGLVILAKALHPGVGLE